ncbi:MAG: hypothetical protein J6U35_01760 [Clostridia bacterium]|nr:hypothetical protein [Clostridia bacterium]
MEEEKSRAEALEEERNPASAEEQTEIKKRPLAVKMSIAGLILSVLGGIGVIFALVGLIMGLEGKKKDAALYNSAVFVGAGGIALSAIFGTLTAIAAVLLIK